MVEPGIVRDEHNDYIQKALRGCKYFRNYTHTQARRNFELRQRRGSSGQHGDWDVATPVIERVQGEDVTLEIRSRAWDHNIANLDGHAERILRCIIVGHNSEIAAVGRKAYGGGFSNNVRVVVQPWVT